MKKGFTLIELLAVIVILAIIALIVTPVVSGIITSARNSANARSVEGHIRNLELAIISDAFAKASGDLAIYDSTSSNGISNETGIVARGLTIPENDKITCETYNIVNGQVVEARKCADYNNTANWHHTYRYTPTEGAVIEGELGVVPVITFGGTFVAPEDGETHKGIVYMDPSNIETECKPTTDLTVANVGCKKFYIFEVDNINNTYKMIMDRNTTALVAWNSNEENSNSVMKEVKEALETDTANWIGSPRLIEADEVARAIDSTVWDSTTATQNGGMYFGSRGSSDYSNQSEEHQARQRSYYWLFDYTEDCTTYGCKEADSSTKGYWTSTPLTNDEYYVWMVHRYGFLNNSDATNDDLFGVRPVIEVSKDLFN